MVTHERQNVEMKQVTSGHVKQPPGKIDLQQYYSIF
jgi:hypothetical protein